MLSTISPSPSQNVLDRPLVRHEARTFFRFLSSRKGLLLVAVQLGLMVIGPWPIQLMSRLLINTAGSGNVVFLSPVLQAVSLLVSVLSLIPWLYLFHKYYLARLRQPMRDHLLVLPVEGNELLPALLIFPLLWTVLVVPPLSAPYSLFMLFTNPYSRLMSLFENDVQRHLYILLTVLSPWLYVPRAIAGTLFLGWFVAPRPTASRLYGGLALFLFGRRVIDAILSLMTSLIMYRLDLSQQAHFLLLQRCTAAAGNLIFWSIVSVILFRWLTGTPVWRRLQERAVE